ncbi:MAG TPA: AI-2E family transporter [Gaiellales bacterium]|nr:AI-2E family transporter [Gaiellales bacterium]
MPPDAPGKILVPRWVQLVGLPLAIVGVWLLVSAVNHAVFVFVVAALIAILLNPIVRAFCALRIPRGVAVLLVYLFFAFVVGGMSVIVGTVIAREVQDVANQVEDQFKENHGVTPAEQRLADLQRWIDRSSPVKVDVQTPGKRLLNSIDVAHLQRYSGRAVEVARSLLITLFESLFNLVLVIVISVYMLLDAPRLSRFLRRVFRGGELDEDLLTRIERALLAYVKGQTLVSLVIGTTAGVGLWILGLTGVFPGGSTYALGFGAWAAAVEIIPYVGPWLGALAPAAVAATESATALIAVALLFLFIHQIEGHIVIPKLMGSAVKVHPLVVIFALLAAGELYGLAGVLIAMPLVAVGREIGTFLGERIGLERWPGGPITVQVPVALSDPPPPKREPEKAGSDPNLSEPAPLGSDPDVAPD